VPRTIALDAPSAVRWTSGINGKHSPASGYDIVVALRDECFLRKRSSESGRQLAPLACGIAQLQARRSARQGLRLSRARPRSGSLVLLIEPAQAAPFCSRVEPTARRRVLRTIVALVLCDERDRRLGGLAHDSLGDVGGVRIGLHDAVPDERNRPISSVRLPQSARSLSSSRGLASRDRVGDGAAAPLARPVVNPQPARSGRRTQLVRVAQDPVKIRRSTTRRSLAGPDTRRVWSRLNDACGSGGALANAPSSESWIIDQYWPIRFMSGVNTAPATIPTTSATTTMVANSEANHLRCRPTASHSNTSPATTQVRHAATKQHVTHGQ
jgi:hypothetical protein